MTFDFGQLIAHAAKTRNLCAGTIIGTGTVSNRDADGGPGKPIAEGGLGYSRSAEHTSELQSLMRSPYAVFCLKNKTVGLKYPHRMLSPAQDYHYRFHPLQHPHPRQHKPNHKR